MPIVLDYAADGAIIGGYFYGFIPDGAIETGAWQAVLPGAIYARQVHIVDPAAKVHGFFGHVGNGQMGVMAPPVEPVQDMLQVPDGGELGEEALVFSGEGQQPQQLVDENPNIILPPLNANDLRLHSPPPPPPQNPDAILPFLSPNPNPNIDSGSRARSPSPAPTKPSKRRRVTRTNNNTTAANNTPNDNNITTATTNTTNTNKRSLVVKLPIAVNVNEVTGTVGVANSVARKRRLLREEREVASMERQEGAKRKVVRAGDESETHLGGRRK